MAKLSLIDQFSSDKWWEENGQWCGKSREETEAMLERMKREAQQRQLDAWRLERLRHWTPSPFSLPN